MVKTTVHIDECSPPLRRFSPSTKHPLSIPIRHSNQHLLRNEAPSHRLRSGLGSCSRHCRNLAKRRGWSVSKQRCRSGSQGRRNTLIPNLDLEIRLLTPYPVPKPVHLLPKRQMCQTQQANRLPPPQSQIRRLPFDHDTLRTWTSSQLEESVSLTIPQDADCCAICPFRDANFAYGVGC